MDRIHLGQVPRNSSGQVSYQAIRAVPVKVLVAEEELKQLHHKLNRHNNPSDVFRYPESDIAGRLNRKAYLEKRLFEWKALLDQ